MGEPIPPAQEADFIPPPPSLFYADSVGRALFGLWDTVRGLGAFTLITLGVMATKFGLARDVTLPAIQHEQARTGTRVLPMFLFIAAALGLAVVGQTLTRLDQLGATLLVGPIMVSAVVRELGPLVTAMLALAWSGTRNVIELGTARALGEVEALEALRIDPIHYLVVPRVIGMALAVFGLTIYFILATLACGYLFVFVTNVPLGPGEFVHQLSDHLRGLDFVVLTLKPILFGLAIALITCYHGLARPLRLEEVPRAAIRAVAQSVVACVLIDSAFVVIYIYS